MLRNHTRKKVIQTSMYLGLMGMLMNYGQAQVNINSTNPPDASAALEISAGTAAAKKGLLPPRVALTSVTDAVTIPNPATGLIVFNTNAAIDVGLYINNGTPAAPEWGRLQVVSPFAGATITKQIYTAAAADQTKVVSEGNFVFRFNGTTPGSNTVRPSIALVNQPAPATTVSVYVGGSEFYAPGGYGYANTTLNFTNANYATFQNLPGGFMANYELNVFHIVDAATNNYFRVTFYISGPSGGPFVFTIVSERF